MIDFATQEISCSKPNSWVILIMPTIWRNGGFRFVIWPDDHEPPHVHIVRGNLLAAIINLGMNDKPVSVRANYHLNRRELALAVRGVAANNALFVAEWKKLHGES